MKNVVDMARRTLKARGQRGIVVPLRLPGAVGRAMRSGELGGTVGVEGVQTFDEWLRRGTERA